MKEIYEDTDVYFWQLKHSLDEGLFQEKKYLTRLSKYAIILFVHKLK